MAWTYTGPEASDKDAVRFYIGDTNSTDPQLTDGEIDFLISASSTVKSAAAAACRAIAAKYARRVHEEIGDLRIHNQELQKHYLALATSLETMGNVNAIPSAGGVYVADKTTAADNDALVQSQIVVGIHDFE